MTKHLLILFVGVLGFPSTVRPAQSQPAARGMVINPEAPRRRALVIGNASYGGAATLMNTVNDARAVTATLGNLGFQVQAGENLDVIALERAINTFVERIGAGDVALFYYAGHGMELGGENYLIPVGFRARDEAEAKHQSYFANVLLEKLEARKPRLTIVILDACRNNPFPRGTRGGVGGLAQMQAGTGVYIAFATAPGRTADDNPGGKNGLFTGQLVQALAKPQMDLNEVFDEVRASVSRDSGGTQVPWSTSSVIGRFFFRDIAEQLKMAEAERTRIESDIARTQQEVDRLKQIGQQNKTAQDRDAALQAEARLRFLRLEEDRKRADIKRWEELDRERKKIEEANQEQDAMERRRREGEVRRLAELRERVAALRSSVNANRGQPETADSALVEWRSINAQILGMEAESRQMAQKAAADAGSSYNELVSSVARSKPVKDPFETTQDFQNRFGKYEAQMKQIEARRQAEAASVRNNYEGEMAKAVAPYKERQALIERGYYPIKDSVLTWKYYDADQSALWMDLGGTLLLCRVAPADARAANSSRDLLRFESHFRFSASAAEPDGYSVGHPAFAERRACERINADRFVTELNGLLGRNDFEAFRRQAGFALAVGANILLKVKLLHHHSSGFDEFTMVVGRPGLYFEPHERFCTISAGFLASDRIQTVTIVRQGVSGVLLHLAMTAGKNFDKSAPVNFSVLGSGISPEQETSRFGGAIITQNRVHSPAGAENTLSAISWLIEQVRALPPAVGSVPTIASTANPAVLETRSEAVTRGEELTYKIKYNSAAQFGYVYLQDGVVTVTQTAVAFRPTIGAEAFTVSPDKILELNWRLARPLDKPAVHIKVAVKNKKGDKENKKDYYFYNSQAQAVGYQPSNVVSLQCNGGCDDSMEVLFAMLQKVCGKN
ncbi:MAG TPA: caspase family protein [Bryobacteraceae bacterium]